MLLCSFHLFSFFFNDPATTEIYTLSLHDALPIYDTHLPTRDSRVGLRGTQVGSSSRRHPPVARCGVGTLGRTVAHRPGPEDRKSTRLNSSHSQISYAVFCLKKKKKNRIQDRTTNQ